eukprot:11251492-Alexandrium_andersonii.AAC.1
MTPFSTQCWEASTTAPHADVSEFLHAVNKGSCKMKEIVSLCPRIRAGKRTSNSIMALSLVFTSRTHTKVSYGNVLPAWLFGPPRERAQNRRIRITCRVMHRRRSGRTSRHVPDMQSMDGEQVDSVETA